MANIKSQKKRILQAEKARIRNKEHKSEARTLIKQALAAQQNEKIDAKARQSVINKAAKKIDQNVAKKIYHKNKGARLKSQINQKKA